MNPPHRIGEVPHHLVERTAERRAASNQHIIMTGLQRPCRGQPHQFAQAPSHPVALHRIADLPRHRKADPWNAVLGTASGLDQERGSRCPHRGGGCPKIHSALQPLHGAMSLAHRGWSMKRMQTLGPAASSRVTHSDACVRERGAPLRPCGRPWWPSGRESHGGACAPIYSADRSVSRKLPPLARSKMASFAHSAGHCRLAGDAPARRHSTGRAGGRLRRLIRDPSRPVKLDPAQRFDSVLPSPSAPG